ncbi:hypothetical protein [Lacibacter sp. H407]|uniref:hypothetical protein n=1 Tax=Lacibacter sp. H407 TaxID=3133423 RepID=UPI0030BE8D93
MKSILLIVLLLTYLSPFAQTQKKYTIQPGESLLEIVPKNEMYEYPGFQEGVVYFRNGVRSKARLNYNFINEEILFVSPDNDTLTILNPNEVKSVNIGSDQFFYATNRFVKLDTVIGDIKIGVAGFFVVVGKRKVGAYGSTTDGGTDSYGSFVTPANVKLDLVPNIVTTIARRNALFIGNKFNQFITVTKKNIFSLYPEKEAELVKYLNNTKVDFTSRQHLVQLIEYMSRH